MRKLVATIIAGTALVGVGATTAATTTHSGRDRVTATAGWPDICSPTSSKPCKPTA